MSAIAAASLILSSAGLRTPFARYRAVEFFPPTHSSWPICTAFSRQILRREPYNSHSRQRVCRKRERLPSSGCIESAPARAPHEKSIPPGRFRYSANTYRSEVHREVTPVNPRVGHHMAKWIGSAVSQRVLFATQNLGTDLPVFEFKCPRLQCLMIREQRSHSPCRAFLAGHIPPGPAGWGETIPTFLSQ